MESGVKHQNPERRSIGDTRRDSVLEWTLSFMCIDFFKKIRKGLVFFSYLIYKFADGNVKSGVFVIRDMLMSNYRHRNYIP